MTLIVAARFGPFVAQVSDCRVSIRGRRRIHSDIENKAIVFRAIDGIAILGYTGNAYFGSQPTDEWLAEAVSGVTMNGSILYNKGRFLHNRTLSEIFYNIRRKIVDFNKFDANLHLELLVSGFRQHKRAMYSFVTNFGHVGGVNFSPGPLRLPRSRRDAVALEFSIVGDRPAMQDVCDDLQFRLSSPIKSADELSGVLRSIILKRAAKSHLVGRNTMSICIDALKKDVSHEIQFDFPVEECVDAPLTPWICGMTSVMAPSNAIAITNNLGGWSISSNSNRVLAKPRDQDATLSISASSRKAKPF